ncbi:MAG: bis-aminopropyl spermidine synthase family protein [Candidatus Zixiibacteriota bacterium]
MFGEELRRYLRPEPAWVDLVAQVTQHPDRPRPLRTVDQIFMLPGSQLVQALLAIDYLKYRDVVMVGDGDCMSLVVAHLANKGIFKAPSKIRVFDFDERLLAFIEQAIKDLDIPPDLITCHRYNVRNPVPPEFAQAHDVFYTNPPYGSADGGECGKLFLARCMEFCKPAPSWGMALLPFAHKEDWSRKAMFNIQTFLCSQGYVVSEMIREIHQYHLDDRPSLRSCNMVVDRVENKKPLFAGQRITDDKLKNFYGRTARRMPEYISINSEMVFSRGEHQLLSDAPAWRPPQKEAAKARK